MATVIKMSSDIQSETTCWNGLKTRLLPINQKVDDCPLNGLLLCSMNFAEHDDPSGHDISCQCARHLDRLRNDTEREFIQDMVRWTADDGLLSEKQQKWLRDCFVRVRR